MTENETRGQYRNGKTEKLADQLYLAAVLAQLRPDSRAYVAAIDAALLHQTARAIANLAVAACNYGLSDRQEKRREKLAEKVSTIASWYGLTATCGGDPRGYVVRLHGDKLPQNGWGEGFGVA